MRLSRVFDHYDEYKVQDAFITIIQNAWLTECKAIKGLPLINTFCTNRRITVGLARGGYEDNIQIMFKREGEDHKVRIILEYTNPNPDALNYQKDKVEEWVTEDSLPDLSIEFEMVFHFLNSQYARYID